MKKNFKKPKTASRFQKGWQTLGAINSDAGERILRQLKDISPDMARFVIEFPYGDIYSRRGLSIKMRELITIASLTTLGFAPAQLKAHIANALNAGCTREEIVETIMQISVYAGFPAALNGLMTAGEVFDKSSDGKIKKKEKRRA